MAKRGKFGAEKRQKELKKKKKREEKLERKRLKKQESLQGESENAGDEQAEKADGVVEPGGEPIERGASED
jgi:transcription elongation GreA/GreB family factor